MWKYAILCNVLKYIGRRLERLLDPGLVWILQHCSIFLNCPCSVNLLLSLSICYITVCLSIYHLIFITFKITVWKHARQYGDIFKLTKKYSQLLSQNVSFVTFKLHELSKSQEHSLTQISCIPMISMEITDSPYLPSLWEGFINYFA